MESQLMDPSIVIDYKVQIFEDSSKILVPHFLFSFFFLLYGVIGALSPPNLLEFF